MISINVAIVKNRGGVKMDKNQDNIELTVKEVANVIEESPNVVRNWMKDLRDYIPLKKNQSGYNVFDQEALERIKLIKQLHRDRNYSVKQIAHYLATDGEAYKPVPEKGVDELLADEIKGLKDQINELKEHSKRQEEFNRALIEKLDRQNQYIEDRIIKRDHQLLESIKELQEKKQLEAAATVEKQEEKISFFRRLFGK
jgi:DNA-binding transcriptional MerR regulator